MPATMLMHESQFILRRSRQKLKCDTFSWRAKASCKSVGRPGR
jgi:hypothetical protein